jgi:diguanylate cyclase (GGDEF)-like protein/PAS domain S-box-containing protein
MERSAVGSVTPTGEERIPPCADDHPRAGPRRVQAPPSLPALVTESMLDAALVIGSDDGLVVYANPAAENAFGYGRGELLGRPAESLRLFRGGRGCPPPEQISEALLKRGGWRGEMCNLRADGTTFWSDLRITTIDDPEGGRLLVAVHRRIPRAVGDEPAATGAADFEQTFELAPIGMALVGLDGRLERVNQTLCEITSYSAEALLASTLRDITHPEDLDADAADLERLLAGEIRTYQIEKRYFNARGHVVWVLIANSIVRDARGRPAHFITQIQDISDRKLSERRLRNLADNDPLTGLRNRRLFEDDLRQQVVRSQRYGEQAALLLIDLDGFKELNDTCGHQAGDELLRAIARALRQRLRASDLIARIGGDEFAVLLPHVDRAQTAAVARELSAAIAECAVEAGRGGAELTASVGSAHIDREAVSAGTVLFEADRAMYAAKRERREASEQGTD